MRRILPALLLGSFLAAAIHADQPPAKPARKTFYSPNKRYYAVTDPATKLTTVFATGKPARKLWEIPGWHSVAFLSDDPVLIVGQAGNNLIARDYKPADVMLWFYKEGTLTKSFTLQDLIDPKLLRPTASHYSWGAYLGVHEKRFLVELVDGRRLAFDPATGQQLTSR